MLLFSAQEPIAATLFFQRGQQGYEVAMEAGAFGGAHVAGRWEIDLQPGSGGNTADPSSLYIATPEIVRHVVGLLDWEGRGSQVLRMWREPLSSQLAKVGISGLNWQTLSVHDKARPYRLAILHSFTAIGDSIAFMTFLREVHHQFARRGARLLIDLWSSPVSEILTFYEREGLIDKFVSLPRPLQKLASYDGVLNCFDLVMGNSQSLIDVFLQFGGIDPAGVPRERKRNRLRLSPTLPRRIATLNEEARYRFRRLILLSPRSSTLIRHMPVRSIEQLIQEVERHSTWALVTAIPNSIRHEQVLDWSKASSSFEDFAHIMSVCDASLSVDTAAYYIADALDVFSIAFFTNNLGTVWADPYPRVTPIQVGEPGPLGTLHGSTDPNLIAYADKLWTPAHIKVAVDMLAELFSSL